MKRVLILATTTGYQTRMFAEAAERQGIDLIYATDRCDQLDDPWRDGAIAVRFHEEWRSVEALLTALEPRPIDGILALGDRPTVMAAQLARLLNLPGHPPEAAVAARDKRVAREKFRAAGLLVPNCFAVPSGADPVAVLPRVEFPAVLKPTVLSGSRGVIRADDAVSFAAAFARIRRLLGSNDVKELRDPESDIIQIEQYIPGAEFALEGLLDCGRLKTVALFDKPDPLEGPFFEESIYVTPSATNTGIQTQIAMAVERAAQSLGLHHGPIHAEVRFNSTGPYVLEVAARPIGGLCAKTLRFERGGRRIGFEDLLLLHAAGTSIDEWRREHLAAAVMMIPIPRSGTFRRVDGIQAAGAVPYIDEIEITAKPDQQLLALPEGSSYLGFIFARATTTKDAVGALREAHARLRFTIDPLIPIST
ncbi:MAG TPA: ATP-grasp domain-containing protein [Vicinamibacterales bacterium]|nr:ATP-grasp domain-containing protein [Vicinamibacterales bacterium]